MAKKGEEKEEGNLPDDLKSIIQEDLTEAIREKSFEKYSTIFEARDDLRTQEKAWLEEELKDIEPKAVSIQTYDLKVPSSDSIICNCTFLVENNEKIRVLFSKICFQKSQGKWMVKEKENTDSLEYYSLMLRLEGTERFEEIEIPFEGFQIRMLNGYMTPGYVKGSISALVLMGDGRLTSIPTTPRAQSMLNNSTGKVRLEETFSKCWIRISEGDYQRIIRKNGVQKIYPKTVEGEVTKVKEECWTRSYHYSATKGWTWQLKEGNYVADILTENLGWLHYFRLTTDTEPEIEVSTLEPDKLLWGSRPVETIPDRPVDVEHYDIHLELLKESPTIRCEAIVTLRPLEELEEVVLNLNPSLEIDQISDQVGKTLQFSQAKQEWIVTLELSRKAKVGEELTLRFLYHGSINIPDNSQPGRIWDKVSKEMSWLRMEAMWYPLNGYDNLATSDVEIKVPAGFQALCTGEQTGEERTPTVWTTRWHSGKSTRHITIAIARYRFQSISFTDEERTKYGIEGLEVYVTSNLAHKALYILDKAKDILSFYVERYGPPLCPKLRLVEIGDEYQGGYGPPSLLLISPQFLDLLPHELGHQWWGTIIAEAMTEYSAMIYLEARGDKDALVNRLRSLRGGAIRYSVSEPIATQESPGPYTDLLRMAKGMCVIHMLRQVLGDNVFFNGCRRIVEKYGEGRIELFHRPEAVGADQFQEAFEEVSGLNLKGFFDIWFRDTKIPKYSAEWYYGRSGDHYKVTVRINSDPTSHAMMPLEIVTDEHRLRERVLLDKLTVEANYVTKGKPVDVIFNYDQSFLGTDEKSHDLLMLARSISIR